MTRIASAAGAVAVTVAFFLPWLAGEDVFELRTFSGFDLARLIRNFEITATSTEETGQFRLAAVALYLVPALAINGAVLHQLQGYTPHLRSASYAAMMLALVYGLLALGGLLFLAAVQVNDFERYAGWPRAGFYLTLGGLAVLGLAAVADLRRR